MRSPACAAALVLLLGCSGAPVVAGDKPAWREQLRAALYERAGPDGEAWGRWGLDPLLNEHTGQHLLEGASRDRALEAVNGFLAAIRDGTRLSPLEAALIQRDLWPVHDWASSPGPGGPGDHARERTELARRIAEAMATVALDADEIARLPATLGRTASSGRQAAAWDPTDPTRPFLPRDLAEAGGGWACLGDEEGRIVAPFHLRLHRGRSSFEILARLPEGPEATRAWISRVRERLEPYSGRPSAPADALLPDPPKGTLLALVRRALLVDRAGEVRVSPIVESLQLRVHGAGLVVPGPNRQFNQPMRDQPAVFEWRLTRDGNLLAPVGADEVGFVNFENMSHDPFEPEPLGWAPPEIVLDSCVACHDGRQRANGILTLSQGVVGPGPVPSALVASKPGVESARFARWKSSEEAFTGLRAAFQR